jgi:hypothetical protein
MNRPAPDAEPRPFRGEAPPRSGQGVGIPGVIGGRVLSLRGIIRGKVRGAMDFIEASTAVLYAIVIYAIYYGITGVQVYKVLIADEEPLTRVFWFIGIAFVSLMFWAIVGGVVYWGILIWFRIWLQDPHAWQPAILSATGWFPFGLILKHGPFPEGGVRGLVIFAGYPVVLLIAAGVMGLCLRARDAWEERATSRTRPATSARPKENAR